MCRQQPFKRSNVLIWMVHPITLYADDLVVIVYWEGAVQLLEISTINDILVRYFDVLLPELDNAEQPAEYIMQEVD